MMLQHPHLSIWPTRCKTRHGLLRLLGLLFTVCILVFFEAPCANAQQARTFEGFSALRNELLNIVGGSTQRIWIATDFFSDGEIATAIYIAQYRKLNIAVLLGRGKATLITSRLNYFKNQNIPVYLRPRDFEPNAAAAPTVIIADGQLYTVNGELDSNNKTRRFELRARTPAELKVAEDSFNRSISQPQQALRGQPMPLVGKSKNEGKYLPLPGNPRSSVYPAQGSPSLDNDGVYRFTREQKPRPRDVPSKLPKNLKVNSKGRTSLRDDIGTDEIGENPDASSSAKVPPADVTPKLDLPTQSQDEIDAQRGFSESNLATPEDK